MNSLDNLKSVLEREIDKVTSKGEIAPTEIKAVGEAVDIIKDIETICAMKEYGQEDDMYSMENRGYSTRRMPRYPMYRDSYAYDNSYENMSYRDMNSNARGGRGNYSMHTEKEEMIEKLERMMNNATSEKERRDIMDCINKLEA